MAIYLNVYKAFTIIHDICCLEYCFGISWQTVFGSPWFHGCFLCACVCIPWKVAAAYIPCANIPGVAALELDQGSHRLPGLGWVWPEGDGGVWLGRGAAGERGWQHSPAQPQPALTAIHIDWETSPHGKPAEHICTILVVFLWVNMQWGKSSAAHEVIIAIAWIFIENHMIIKS